MNHPWIGLELLIESPGPSQSPGLRFIGMQWRLETEFIFKKVIKNLILYQIGGNDIGSFCLMSEIWLILIFEFKLMFLFPKLSNVFYINL